MTTFRLPVLSVTELEVLKAMIVTRRAIEISFKIGTGIDRSGIAHEVQRSVKHYDEMMECYAVWAWTLKSTGAQACPCVISTELFDKFVVLAESSFFDPEDPRAPEHLKAGFQAIKDYQPAVVQALKEAGTNTQDEIDAAGAVPTDKSMLN
mgnify:CR=1 FL=1|jgi:hypothetical protein